MPRMTCVVTGRPSPLGAVSSPTYCHHLNGYVRASSGSGLGVKSVFVDPGTICTTRATPAVHSEATRASLRAV
jgi:hypothetical protein